MVSAKFKCEILFHAISDATNMSIRQTVTIEKTERKKVALFSFTFSIVTTMVLGLSKWLKETRFYKRKKNII